MNTMEFKKIIFSGIFGTTAMTILSYLASELLSENFREPQILAILISNFFLTAKRYALFYAWGIHYLIGFGFVVFFIKLWDNNLLKPTLSTGIILGAISGIIGIIGWYILLKIHPNPPFINLNDYFILLFFAHIVFGIYALIGYILIKKLIAKTE